MYEESISIYNRNNLINIGIRDIEKYHGGLCPGILIGFKATELAIERLWNSEVPQRDEFLITISEKVCECVIDSFEFITRARSRGNLIIKPTNKRGIDWSFIFVRRSTDRAIEIRLKDAISPRKRLPKSKRDEFSRMIKNSDAHKLFYVKEKDEID
ncbi:MAG: hypothetical protein DRO92_04315 [Candidatus Altiarchaeales archaeon]|nr:MAG: hypothetical protein DRO92_04315 [Candidatus Altiarchaeales archaeon]